MFRKSQAKRRNDELDEEDLLYGTPFPPIEDQSSASKKQELDQTVRDENGRRRLHGAFTGGFSAGYWNTVGSKEGWTPSQFISRKNDRSKRRDYKPEDFMDDEDFGEFGIAPKQVKAKDKFFSTSEGFAGFRDSRASTIDDVLKDVITLNSMSIGVRILKRMKKNAVQRLSKDGCLASDHIFPLEFDENDLKSIFLNPKKNLNGLGYRGLSTNVNFGSDARLEAAAKSEYSTIMKDGKKLKISGEAFGYGALDEDDGYEAEVYTFDDLSKYDYTLSSNKETNKSGHLFNSILSDSHLMDDFTKAEEDFREKASDSQFKISVPPDWTPRPPTNRKGKRKSRWDNKSEENQNSQKRSLDANQRAEILGEDEGSLEREQIEAKLQEQKGEPKKLVEERQSISEKEYRSLEEQVTIKQEDEPKFKKPLTGFFASKFVQSTNTPLDVLKPGLTKIESLPQTSKPAAAEQEETKSFVGKANREIYQWHPHKLLCKRFNVPHPYPQFPDVVGVLAFNKSKQSAALEAFLAPKATVQPAAPQPVKREIPEVIEEFVKPDMNLFKAVFDLSDDDDDLSDIEEIEEVDTGKPVDSQPADDQSSSGTTEKSIKLSNVPSELKASSSDDPPRIVFNKSFVKRSADSSKDDAEVQKSRPKRIALNLFENEMDLSDEEGVNLLEIKRKNRSAEQNRPDLDQLEQKPEPKQKPDQHIASHSESKSERTAHRDPVELESKQESKASDSIEIRVAGRLKEPTRDTVNEHPDKNSEPEKLSESDGDLDDLVDAIMKPESSLHSGSHKKKRKKHKEHKKHKKKHKRSSRDSD